MSTDGINPTVLAGCVTDAIALMTVAMHDDHDIAVYIEALELVQLRDDEELRDWIARLGHLVTAQAAIANGMTAAFSDHTGVSPHRDTSWCCAPQRHPTERRPAMNGWMHDDDCDRCRRGRARARRTTFRQRWGWTVPYLVVAASIVAIAALNGALGYGPHR
jgi:hypothetical protein